MYGKYETKFINSEIIYLHQGNQNQSLSKYQKQKCKKKNIHWMWHILKGYLQDFVCVCVVCVCVEGGG